MSRAANQQIYDLFLRDSAVDLSERKLRSYPSHNKEPLLTIFNDYEALSVCRGLVPSNPGYKAWKRYECGYSRPEDDYLMQKAAMEAVDYYGRVQISQLMALPTASFKSARFTEAFSELDIRRKRTRSPLIRITFSDESSDEEFQLQFLVSGSELDEDTIVLSRRAGRDLMHVTRAGVLNVLPEAVVTPPILRLFVQFCNDPRSAIIHYGLKLGICSVCGRPLSNPRSLEAGIGPICAGKR